MMRPPRDVRARNSLACRASRVRTGWRRGSAARRLDIFQATKAQRRPVGVNRDRAHRVEARCSQNVPARIAVEFTAVAFGGPLRIGKPQKRIIRRLGGKQARQPVKFGLRDCKRQGKLNGLGPLRIAQDYDILQRFNLRLKGSRCVDHQDLALRLQVQFRKNRGQLNLQSRRYNARMGRPTDL